jgi:type I restriction enzyme S subunit
MSFPAYPAYRDSGVPWLGRVPAHWNLTRLRFIARFNPSKSEIGSLLPETEVSFLPMGAIGDDGSLRLDATRPLNAVEQGYTYFRDGDLLIARITPCFENGKGALVAGLLGGIGFGTTELIVVRPLPGRAVASYLNWLFMGPDFRNAGTAAMYGAGGQKRVPDEFVRNFVVAVPPPAEQRAIAAFLDRECGKIDTLIAEAERAIALLKERRAARYAANRLRVVPRLPNFADFTCKNRHFTFFTVQVGPDGAAPGPGRSSAAAT